jgi:hypothetical protein
MCSVPPPGADRPALLEVGKQMDRRVAAYCSGGAVGRAEHGAAARAARAAANGRRFAVRSAGSISRAPEHRRSAARRRSRRHVGCGFGWSSIGIALTYPHRGGL